ncbi:hypothetical protein PHK61_31190 [Actinomycetospora lutea]|uniref:hypothetical protein n=1 Tax=Actinomycetospora lutea TaxID=663604 RepID=UPI00236501BC|nr:hypothetical protein [Actinomycetospora lutea]MDD7942886.1 hypothetical protein [Actinomycetospora lutea]
MSASLGPEPPRIVLKSGAVLEYPQEMAEDVRGVDDLLSSGAASTWMTVGPHTTVHTDEIAAVSWSGDVRVVGIRQR